MLILLLVLGIILLIGGFFIFIYGKTRQEEIGVACQIIGASIVCVSFMSIIIFGTILSNRMIIDDKIAVYQTENKNIEAQIIRVALFQELKTDELIKKQIDLYVSNNQKIKELEVEKLSYKPFAWWIYFGS